MTVEFARTLSDGRSGFAALLDAIEALLESHGVPQAAAAQMMIAFDEVISNVLNHGADETIPQVEVSLNIQDGRIDAEVLDDGKPFDPLAAPPPNLDLDIDERPIGGLGIHLVRELMDGISYERDRGKNRLRISKTYLLE